MNLLPSYICIWMIQRTLNYSCSVVTDIFSDPRHRFCDQIQVLCKSSVVPLVVYSPWIIILSI